MLRVAKISFVVFCTVALQVSVAAQLPIDGAMVDVILVGTIGAALAGGPEAGAAMGFICGLLIDLLGAGPVGLTALVYTLVGYGVGVAQAGVLRSSRLIPIVTAGVAALVATYAYALVGQMLGQNLFVIVDVNRVAIVVTLSTMMLCLPARRLMGWAFAEERSTQVPRSLRW